MLCMTIEQAKDQLKRFLGDTTLNFTFETFDDGEWTAVCNEIPSIVTGGKGVDITTIDAMIREAIVVAAGIDPIYKNDVLNFKGAQPVSKPLISVFSKDMFGGATLRSAEYVLS